ncbi:MAG: DegT/DnrJ/EryC1/StrS family aminotransferase [Alphaproteobacteria bacterium]|nr:DegT/DnrJ/EryC1/StrS family aminotransferase [Alphaproteobacteria bacterium]
MSADTLALLGGTPVIDAPLAPYRSMGVAERQAVLDVLESDCLSGFYGSPGPEFMGGPRVRDFEERWAAHVGARHAISVNSATSGLIAAMGAVGISPGDEVIVPPTTMSATVMAPLFYGGIPVFADIEDVTFCLDPASVRDAITPRTRAICAVNLFGHPARLAELRALADRHGLWLIEDSSQAPTASEHGRRAGTIGHVGVFSLNYHKHIHTGEGGVCVTDDDTLAQRLALIRNHGENCVEGFGLADLTNMAGYNFRLTELQAAIGLAQLERIETHVVAREILAQALTKAAAGMPGLTPPAVRDGCRHNYYCWTATFDAAAFGASRDAFSAALAAEGFPHFTGYVAPLYRLPLFRERKAIGRDGFPFTLSNRHYDDGLCPVAERLWREAFLLFEPCAWAVDDSTAPRLARALHKVAASANALARWDAARAPSGTPPAA